MRRAVLAALPLVLLAGCAESDADDGPLAEDKSIEAQIFCETFVERELRAPATAEYIHETTKEVDPDVWVVTGTVDAENGFSALVRNRYSCRMREIEGGWEPLKGRMIQRG